MEGTEVYTVAATATKLFIIGDKPQLVMPQGTGRANLNAGGIGAVHTGSAVKKPAYFSFRFYFPEFYLEPSLRRQVRRILVAAAINSLNTLVPMPLLACYLAGTAGDAQR